MPSSYPAGYDSFINPIPTDALDSIVVPHDSNQHGKVGDAIQAIQGALGLDPHSPDATVRARLDRVDGEVAAVVDGYDAKADLDSPTFTGNVVLPSGTTWDGYTLGDIGATGGVPGGTRNQVLMKLSDVDFDADWVDWPNLAGPIDTEEIVPEPYPTGGTITTFVGDGTNGFLGSTYRVHTFGYTGGTQSFVNPNPFIGKLLLAGGGGSAGATFSYDGGGGGAGTLYEMPYAFGAGTHNAIVGNGGSIANGGDSRFDDIICYGGGKGGDASGADPLPGGSGGGGEGLDGSAGAAATGGSLNGGATSSTALPFRCHAGGNGTWHNQGGGGGGAGSAGSGDQGGSGFTSYINGTGVAYCRGGWDEDIGSGPPGSGGNSIYSAWQSGQPGVAIVRYRIA
jgi:hypothetical protein